MDYETLARLMALVFALKEKSQYPTKQAGAWLVFSNTSVLMNCAFWRSLNFPLAPSLVSAVSSPNDPTELSSKFKLTSR